jgi:hypothetical protein
MLSRTGAENAQIGEFFSQVLGLDGSGDAGVGTTSADVSGPHGVLVELYEWRES